MAELSQQLVPGVVGISTYVDGVYHRAMQLAAVAAANSNGPINQLRVLTATLDFRELIANLMTGLVDAAERQVAAAVETLEAGGADFVVVTSGTTSTLTRLAHERTSMHFLDLAAAAWGEVADVRTCGVLCTRRATAGGIFQRVADQRGVQLLESTPPVAGHVDEVIFGELVHGEVSESGLRVLQDGINDLVDRGAEIVILGNTDMTLALAELTASTQVPLVDSATAHARAAAHAALHGLPPQSSVL